MNDRLHKKSFVRIISLFFFFSCVSTFLAYNFHTASAYSAVTTVSGNGLTGGDISMLSGAFSPLVCIGGSPFIALTILSGAGCLLNNGVIGSDSIPLSNALMALPIANTSAFVILLVITIMKLLLSMLGPSKVLSDATLGKLENILGTVSSVGGAFLLTLATTAQAAEVATMSTASTEAGTYIFTSIIAFMSAVFAYMIYAVIKTMLSALDIFAFLFSPIPGSTALFTIMKCIVLSAYTWFSVANPAVAMIVGIILVVIACFVFRAAKRMELYYRKIYLTPFFHALFRRKHSIPLIPKRLPRGVATEFPNINLCIECFFMNKAFGLYKRELCSLIRSGETNYIFKKRLFGKVIKFELSDETFIEKPFIFRFLRIFSDEALRANQRRINLVIRREHGKNIAEIIAKTGLIDYNALVEERRRKKAEEKAQKAEEIKAAVAEKISSAGNKMPWSRKKRTTDSGDGE